MFSRLAYMLSWPRSSSFTIEGLPWSLVHATASDIAGKEQSINEAFVLGQLWTSRDDGDTILHRNLCAAAWRLILRVVPEAFIDSLDDASRTPLMRAAGRGLPGDLDGVVYLLAHGADPNARDSHGKTALHHAAAATNEPAIKALLSLGATTDPTDEENHPRFSLPEEGYISEGQASVNRRILNYFSIHELVADGDGEVSIDHATREHRDVWEREKIRGKRDHILSIDGGGMRGLVALIIIGCLERRSGRSIGNSFKWIAGTSTGAIIAVALASGKTPLETILLYLRMKDDIFRTGRASAIWNETDKVLEMHLAHQFGKNSTMDSFMERKDERGRKRVLVTTVDASVKPEKLHCFLSYSPVHRAGEEEDTSYTTGENIVRALRCSSAAPSYFTPVDKRFYDGGIFANNPTMHILHQFERHTDLRRKGGHHPPLMGCVLSIGTGIPPEHPSEAVGDFSSSRAILRTVMNAHKLFDLAIDKLTCAQTDVAPARTLVRNKRHAEYFRFSPRLDVTVDLNETDNEKLVEMMWATKEYMHKHLQYILLFSDFMDACDARR